MSESVDSAFAITQINDTPVLCRGVHITREWDRVCHGHYDVITHKVVIDCVVSGELKNLHPSMPLSVTMKGFFFDQMTLKKVNVKLEVDSLAWFHIICERVDSEIAECEHRAKYLEMIGESNP